MTPTRLKLLHMEIFFQNLLTNLSQPEYGLAVLFAASLLAATLIPLGSEPLLLGLIAINPSLLWPALAVATLGNTLGGMVGWWMGLGAERWMANHLHQDKVTHHMRALRWLERVGPVACLGAWLPTTPENVTTSKLAVGWLRAVGVKSRLQILDPGALNDAIANYTGSTFTPDFDTIIWWWEGDAEDPQFILSLLTPAQIGGWSDTSWTDPQYTKLFAQQSTTIDPQARIALVQQMQEIAYQASPYIIFGYPQFLEAYNTAKWTGYVKEPSGFPGYNGSAFHYDTFLELKPATAATAAAGGPSTSVYAVIAGVAVVIVVVIVLVRRRRGPEVEPQD